MNEQDIFIAARHIDSTEERSRYLADACDNVELRHRVETLLKAQDDAGSFLVMPAAAGHAPTVLERGISETVGMVIGPYKLLEQIGEGGFGVVFMAEQTVPVRRKVALKVIKPGMDTREVIARFEAERQALALMDHPHIARVLDAGATATGRPFFVMELVRGIPITEYCDRHQLALRKRLKLFVTICQAVQHAHQKGIIHRDIKPSNVLVTQHDEKAVVKVIDFGVAKATSGQLTDKTLFTGFTQMIGTPLYMSPEQAEMSGLGVDTRTDIYGLGVLLYELLTGTTPFDKVSFQTSSFDEIRRIIREQEPSPPSARISTLARSTTVSTDRRSDPQALHRQCRGELDWIVMKCLEKDRNRRYETASALAADVTRFLSDEPVQACPPSAMYRCRKFARRNRTVLLSASAVALAGVLAAGALMVSTSLVWRANEDLSQALDRERQEANFHRITVAHRDLSTDDLGHALKLLEACPEDLRQWEWHYLMRLSRVDPVVLKDQTGVHGIAFSPDGRTLASASADGRIRIWDSTTGVVVQTIAAHQGPVLSVSFHPGGGHVASSGADQQVKVWDLATGQEEFYGPCDAIRRFGTAYTVAFSPNDGRKLAASSDGIVRIWDWRSRQLLHSLPGHESHSVSVAFSGDGRRLATSGASRGVQRIWDADIGGLPLGSFPAHHHPVSAMAFSPDGRQLASASFDRLVHLCDTATGALLHALPHAGNVDCVAFSPDGRRVASGGEDKIVRIWDAASGREVLSLRGHTGRCGCVAFSPDGLRLASASTDGTIRIWDATPLRENEGQALLNFARHDGDVYSLAISPDGNRVASAGYDPTVKVWDLQTGRLHTEFGGHTVVVFSIAWHPDGRRIVSAGSGGPQHSVRVWDAHDGRQAFALAAGPERFAVPYFAAAFSPDGRYLVTGQGNGALQVWDAETGQELATLDRYDREIRGVVFSPNGLHVASASGDGVVKLWDAMRLTESQEPRHRLPGRAPGACLNVAFSPDSQRLATGGEENTVKIWDVQTGQELRSLNGHSGEVYTMAFSPDHGRWIASAGEDSAVKIWDSHAGTFVRNFRGHTGLVSSLAFSPDGRRLISASRDATVKVWDVTRLHDHESNHQTR